MATAPVFRGALGLNNVVEPHRLKYREDGFCELAEAVNVIIDDSGSVKRRFGIVTAAQIPAALAALEAAVARDEARLRAAQVAAQQEPGSADANPAEDEPNDTIHLRQRATPFIDLLRRSQQEGCDVVWGV